MIACFSSGIPSTAVYLVLPASMAWIAASLMLAGVSKSGSPAPRPMTLRPAALSSRALSVTAIVADGFTRSSAADRNGIVISLQDIANTPGVATDPRLFFLGSQHPKAGDAASQEAWPAAPKLSLMSKGRRRIRATFIKFCGKMTHIRQGLRSDGWPTATARGRTRTPPAPRHDDGRAPIESRRRDPNCSVVLAGFST